VEGQITHLNVEAAPLKLNAGHNTTVTLTVINDFEPIYDLDVNMQFAANQLAPSPVILGLSHWKFSKVEKGSNVSFQVIVYVSDDAAGNGFSASLMLLYKRLGYISPYTETHAIGFYAKGFIDTIVYDFSTDPDPALIGEDVAISASILNKGNIPAMFTNASLASNPAIILMPESYSYLGQVDPNSPAPFTVETKVKSDLNPGDYVLKLIISYQDDELISHTIERQLTLTVTEFVTYTPPTTTERVMGIVQRWLLLIVVAVLVIIIVVAAVSVLRRRGEEEIESF